VQLKKLRHAVVAITLASTLTLVGCTSEAQKAADESAAAGDAAAASLNLTELPINEKFTDPETDDKIEIVSIAHNVPVEKIGDETYSLLKVTIKQGKKFSSYVNENSFQLSSDNGASWEYPASHKYEELVAKGFPAQESSVGVGDDEEATVTRWYLMEIAAGTTSLKGQYYRPEGKTYGGESKTIPEFIQEFPVPMS
jgi:hypothetical protein